MSQVAREILREALEERPLGDRTRHLRGALSVERDQIEPRREALRARKLARLRNWLVDTGPLVAYLDASDPAHRAVARGWDGFAGRLTTTSTVITEANALRGSGPPRSAQPRGPGGDQLD